VSYEGLNNCLKENIEVVCRYGQSTSEFELQIIDSNGIEKVIIVHFDELKHYVKENIKFKGINNVPFIQNQNKQKKKPLN